MFLILWDFLKCFLFFVIVRDFFLIFFDFLFVLGDLDDLDFF